MFKYNFFIIFTIAIGASTLPIEENESPPVDPEFLAQNAFQGDIILKSEDKKWKNGRNGIISNSTRWIDGIVPYVINSAGYSSENIALIKSSLNDIATNVSCVKFVERTNEANYVYVNNTNNGCYSYLGRVGGLQELSLMHVNDSYTCLRRGIIQHEFLHALGFHHMHSTETRDAFVRISFQNIIKGAEGNFVKQTGTTLFNTPYDYGSVLHYPKNAFGINGKTTITPTKDKNAVIGQRVGLSDGDYKRLRAMYNCPLN